MPIGPCPTQSINSPAHSALPTACRATLSPARSARPPSSGGSHGGWCSTRPGSPRHRKIVLRTIAIFQDNFCHGLGFNQFVTTIILKNGYGPPTPPKPAMKCAGSMVGPSSSARSGLLSCKLRRRTLLVLTAGPGSRRQTGKTAPRPPRLPPERGWQSTVQCRAEPCRAVPGGARGFLFVTGGPVSAGPRREATRGGRKRPFCDTKRGGPC